LKLATGMKLAEASDLLGSLAWFADVLKRDEGDPRWEPMHRIRLGTILRQCPTPIQVWFHDGRVTGARYDRTARRVVTASADRRARVWDVASGAPIGRPLVHDDVVHEALFNPDGDRVVTASADRTARVWNFVTCEAVVIRHPGEVLRASFSPDGK